MATPGGAARSITHEMSLLEGEWPQDIRGHHWINGTGRRLPWQKHSIFAPGVLQRLDLEPSGGALRWHVRDSHAPDVRAALDHLDVFGDPRAFQILGGPLLTGVNNSFFLIDDRVFLTADFNRPWEIDPESMRLASAVGSVREWGGTARLAMLSPPVPTTAHPFYDRRERILYDYTSKPLPENGTSLARFQHQLFVATWDGAGEVRRWEVPGAGLAQYVHEIAGTRHFIVLLESCSFNIETGIALLGLPKLEPHLPVSNLYVIRKSDLNENNRVRGVPFRKITVPCEAFHILADYEDDGRAIDLWLTHGNGLDFLASNTADDVHWKTGKPFERWQLDRFIHADYAPIGRYRIDVESQSVLESNRVIDFDRWWGAGVWSWDPRPANPKDSPLYVSWLGYDSALVSRRLMELYGDRPHRILPPGSLPDGSHPPALTVVDWGRGEVVQDYRYPEGTTTLANQFIPRDGEAGSAGGWIGVYLVSSKPQVEYWLFDAAHIARGPVARIGCADLRAERTIHHTWTAHAPARRSTYRVPLSEDLGNDWRHLPEPFRRVVESALGIAGE